MAALSERIAERLENWCPNSPKPQYSVEAWREIFAAEDELAARQIASEAKSLGIDTLRRENKALRQRVAKLEAKDRNWPEVIGRALGTTRKEIEARIDALEQRQLKFMGVHEAGRAYTAHSLVVKRGGLWVALTDTVVPPGTNSDWQLCVKSGEIAKEQGR